MKCENPSTQGKKGYDPKIKPEEYEEWLKTICQKVANGEEELLSFLDEEGSHK